VLPPPTARSTVYFVLACVIAGVGVIALLGAAGFYWWELGIGRAQELSRASADWGTFGDFVSGIAGTVIAMCTLVALAITLNLQAKELEATRQELGKQTHAANQQLEYEARRQRPMIKTEWFPETFSLEWRITNVGFGPCIIDRVELTTSSGSPLGEFHASADPSAQKRWEHAVSNTWTDEPHNHKPVAVELLPLNDFKRVLGRWRAAKHGQAPIQQDERSRARQ
jgi:hypothetical protein